MKSRMTSGDVLLELDGGHSGVHLRSHDRSLTVVASDKTVREVGIAAMAAGTVLVIASAWWDGKRRSREIEEELAQLRARVEGYAIPSPPKPLDL